MQRRTFSIDKEQRWAVAAAAVTVSKRRQHDGIVMHASTSVSAACDEQSSEVECEECAAAGTGARENACGSCGSPAAAGATARHISRDIKNSEVHALCSLMLARAATVLVAHEHARAQPPATQQQPPPAPPWPTLRQLMSRLWAKVESEATAFVTGTTGA